ncbi:putative pectate lyase 17 [Andrographis paniculata]|uniref:putative pectate lyase 17 n=1 Tax=Andrographis paniculata TaxID=175694 RepID=UPI0021E70D7F|nr:putative pectate lyase 17 [Andrographis paniculata]
MTNNTGPDVTMYTVTDPSDDALNPKPGTLRFAMTRLKGKVWIDFERDMEIMLVRPLLVKSHTTIDGRGAEVHIAKGACLLLRRVSDVIIHGLKIHDCKAQPAGEAMGPDGQIVRLGPVDGDAIRMVTSSRIWIDHNTLYDCEDGLIDVTRGSTDITISNNWFRFQNKVMLLGHNDGFRRDTGMKVTVVFNHFGPQCRQRMPRIRFGYAHVVNNLYLGWGLYAMGGSMDPSIKSEANLFIARGERKEIMWNMCLTCNFRSVNDVFENGALFTDSSDVDTGMKPEYGPHQVFEVADGKTVRALTKSSGALKCPKTSPSLC